MYEDNNYGQDPVYGQSEGTYYAQSTYSTAGAQDGKATAILILGILSILCCAPCGIAAIIMRNMYKDQISSAKQGITTAGFICGIIGVVLWAIGIIYNIIIYSLYGAAMFSQYM